MVAAVGIGKRLPLALVLLVVAVLLAGCTVVRGTISTISALDDAGYSSPQISSQAGDTFSVTVEREAEDLDAAARDAARIVWEELPLRIERLAVVCDNGFGGEGRFQADRADLVEAFEARPAALDEGVQEEEVRNLLIGLAIAGVVGVLILIGIVVAIVLLVRRNRRRRAPPPGYPGHPAYPDAPQPPYPPTP